jgi:hypothetical protein
LEMVKKAEALAKLEAKKAKKAQVCIFLCMFDFEIVSSWHDFSQLHDNIHMMSFSIGVLYCIFEISIVFDAHDHEQQQKLLQEQEAARLARLAAKKSEREAEAAKACAALQLKK